MDLLNLPCNHLSVFFFLMLSNDVFIPLMVYNAETKTKQGEKDSRH